MPHWFEIIWRTLMAVIVLFGMTKLLGKRQITQLSLFEYMTGITIGDLAAAISLDIRDSWYLGAISLAVWVSVSLGIEFLQLKSKKVRDFVDGKATVLVKDGKVMEDNLKKVRIVSDELLGELRKKSVFKVADVEFATMEPSGEINVLLKKAYQPLTPSHLGIQVAPENEPQTVIMDGKILDEPLATRGFSREWLFTELEKIGISVENVYLGQVDAFGEFYADVYDDNIQIPEPNGRKMLYASLKKVTADIELFALATEKEEAKQLYEQSAKAMNGVLEQITPLLKR
ncbi:MAG: hypothetical protein A2189_05485 [Paenibacillus sp. RIFOXYA1_FULL_44_5]|nr:MAG: hypothetical protein A2189_05485 [Paenibacillus sp. RIFOXYA1_FULL_44_5]